MKSIVSREKLTKDYTISTLLKGGWQLAGGHGLIDREQAIEDMFKYVESGITTFDCADIYTGVEEMIGEFLKQYSKRYGKKSLENIQIHTKYVPDLAMLETVSPEDTERIIDRSIKRLGVDRLNLVQFHWWDYSVPRYIEVALTLKKLKEKGKIQNIGVTNFDVIHLKELIDAGIPIVSSQNQYSVIDQRPENGLIEFCQKNNIKILCYGTTGGGFISDKYLGQAEPKEPLENRSLTKYKLIIDDFGGWELFQELLSDLSVIARKHGVSLTNVAQRYILDMAGVAGVIVGARNVDHLQDNLKVFGIRLDREDKEMIMETHRKSKSLEGDVYYLERLKGGKHAGIMKYNLNKV